jgi:hypothetical protein
MNFLRTLLLSVLMAHPVAVLAYDDVAQVEADIHASIKRMIDYCKQEKLVQEDLLEGMEACYSHLNENWDEVVKSTTVFPLFSRSVVVEDPLEVEHSFGYVLSVGADLINSELVYLQTYNLQGEETLHAPTVRIAKLNAETGQVEAEITQEDLKAQLKAEKSALLTKISEVRDILEQTLVLQPNTP